MNAGQRLEANDRDGSPVPRAGAERPRRTTEQRRGCGNFAHAGPGSIRAERAAGPQFLGCFGYTCFQSFFMLTTSQPRFAASSSPRLSLPTLDSLS
jgi:hypothetical protein